MERCTYRIVTEHGTVAFARDYDLALYKYMNYVTDMLDGYCKDVRIVRVDNDTCKETTICGCRR